MKFDENNKVKNINRGMKPRKVRREWVRANLVLTTQRVKGSEEVEIALSLSARGLFGAKHFILYISADPKHKPPTDP